MDIEKILQNYIIAMVNNENSHIIYRILEKRERNSKYLFESNYESLNYVRKTKFLILDSSDTPTFKNFRSCIFNLHGAIDEIFALFPLSQYLREFIDSDKDEITIIIDENNIDDFRLACFISSFVESKEKNALIIDTSFTIIPKLYVPVIQKSSLGVLFSIVRYRINYGEYPDIRKLREYHFTNIKSNEMETYPYGLESDNTILSGKKGLYRNWNTSEDSKFVQTVYAAQRMLEKMGLVIKRKNNIDGTIEEIIPTINGVLIVIFSEMSNIFTNER